MLDDGFKLKCSIDLKQESPMGILTGYYDPPHP